MSKNAAANICLDEPNDRSFCSIGSGIINEQSNEVSGTFNPSDTHLITGALVKAVNVDKNHGIAIPNDFAPHGYLPL